MKTASLATEGILTGRETISRQYQLTQWENWEILHKHTKPHTKDHVRACVNSVAQLAPDFIAITSATISDRFKFLSASQMDSVYKNTRKQRK